MPLHRRYFASRGGLWLGWSGKIEPEVTGAVETTNASEHLAVATIPLSPQSTGLLPGYSNSVLWPVFHTRLDLAQFEAGYFDVYASVNRRMAASLRPLLRADDTIWVHDYHMIPLGMELRALGVTNPIGFFLHIPVPPAQTFLAIPEHSSSRAAVGLRSHRPADQVDVGNLIDYLQDGVFGRILQDGRIRVFDRELSIASFPVGIDDGIPVRQARAQAARPRAGPDHASVIGVDRLDYTKGLPQKFRAFGRFLEKYPENCGQVVLSQIAPPTRESVVAYADIRTSWRRCQARSTAASASSTGCRSTTSTARRRASCWSTSIAPPASAS